MAPLRYKLQAAFEHVREAAEAAERALSAAQAANVRGLLRAGESVATRASDRGPAAMLRGSAGRVGGAAQRRSALERQRERALALHVHAAEVRAAGELDEFNALHRNGPARG
jgi:hypothetical protein